MTIVVALVTAVSSGTLSWLFTIKHTRKQAAADAMQSVQDVYQELITDLNNDRQALKAENDSLRTVIKDLQEKYNQMEAQIRATESRLAHLRPLLCSVVGCPNRKKYDQDE